MQTLWYILSGLSDFILLILVFVWGFDFARKDRSKAHKHHYGLWTLCSMMATFIFMMLAGSGK
ncbi:hypothetical protein [Secundilactobacillus mixtipabuli]|uniref:Uncharacterized protein n=1 Tax=Secundilactobacillus mixtipabuli TaxID=1435342 RepID=A0A1Z5IBE0_9LACO|nr:hypothetical protein [Secundilactobacillus mixtipabuli]GAW99064.1 hypothetical protein IWT30_01024 [Secundilactobacillus mixtipabuli]